MLDFVKKHINIDKNVFALLWLLLPFLVMGFVMRYAQRQLTGVPLDQAKIYENAYLWDKVDKILVGFLDEKPLDIDIYYRYLKNHCEIAKSGAINETKVKAFLDRSQSLIRDPQTADIGFFGLGYMESCAENYQTALVYFSHLGNPEQKYLNASIGSVYESLDKDTIAESYYEREISINGDIKGTVEKLTELYRKHGELQKLQAIINNENTREFINLASKSYLAFRTGNILEYLNIIVVKLLSRINGFAALSALLICTIWFFYLWRIDYHTQQPLSLAMLVVGMGALVVPLSFFLYDIGYLINPLDLGDGWYRNLVFCVFHVGIIEETVKLLPVIILFFSLREKINDPLDLVLYGGLSALGFATLEDSLYFSIFGIRIISARYILSTVLHMSETMLICYFWARARYIKYTTEYTGVFLGFCLAVLSHGLFDFFLSEAKIIYLLLVLIQTGILIYFTGRVLTYCVVFSARSSIILTSLNHSHLNNYHILLAAAGFLLSVSYLYTNFYLSTEIANWYLTIMMILTIICILPVIVPLANVGLFSSSKPLRIIKKKSYIPVKPSEKTGLTHA